MATQYEPTQYNKIGKTYNPLRQLPGQSLATRTLRTILGDITDLKVLDLACGTGQYSVDLMHWGAKSVAGIDISSGMIDVARAELPENLSVTFHVGDCSDPDMLSKLGLDICSYDVVFASWLLNYAPDEGALRSMFDNIFSALKPGARFVGLTVNAPLIDDFGLGKPFVNDSGLRNRDVGFGTTWEAIETVKDGYKMDVTVHGDPPVQFKCFFLNPEVYAAAAEGAGLKDMKWTPVLSDKQAIKEQGTRFWSGFDQRPRIAVYTASKPL